jgi:hypothetical protein
VTGVQTGDLPISVLYFSLRFLLHFSDTN